MTDAKTIQLAAGYHDLVKTRISLPPDLWNLPTFMTATDDQAIAQWESEYARLGGVIGRRYAEYRDVQMRPMPVWLYGAVPGATSTDPMTFTWSPSYSLQGIGISYDLEVSTTPAFAPSDLVVQERGLRPAIAMVHVPPGTYYWRVITRADQAPDVNWQVPFDDPLWPESKIVVAP
jgi:hypothetical protein